MPIPPGPIIAAGAEIVSSGINAGAQGNMNKKNRKFAEQQALLQRQYSLQDWAMQNEYNHPSAQMARLREAGLNPNLVYGNGADTSSGPIRSSEPAQWKGEAPQINLGGAAQAGLSAYYDTQIKQAQIDNLRVQNTVLKQDELLKASQVLSTNQSVESSKFDLQMKNELKETSLEAAKLGVQKQKADLDYTVDSNDRAAMQNAQSIKEGVERVLRSRAERAQLPHQRALIYAQIESLKRDQQIKDLDLNLRREGVQPNDGIIPRMIIQQMKKFHPIDKAKELRDKYGLKLLDKFK